VLAYVYYLHKRTAKMEVVLMHAFVYAGLKLVCIMLFYIVCHVRSMLVCLEVTNTTPSSGSIRRTPYNPNEIQTGGVRHSFYIRNIRVSVHWIRGK
jgi:hypothetical protein